MLEWVETSVELHEFVETFLLDAYCRFRWVMRVCVSLVPAKSTSARCPA